MNQIIKERKCKFCNETLLLSSNVFSNHVKHCKKRPGSKDYTNLKISSNKRMDSNLGELKNFQVICGNEKCKKEFLVTEREKQYPLKEKYHCSRSCANSKKHSNETREKMSFSSKNSIRAQEVRNRRKRQIKTSQCLYCNETVEDRRFCNKEHRTLYGRIQWTEKQQYAIDCDFKFALKDYPDKFDFELIEKYGWYKSGRYKDVNINGVSRDHIYSINEGFKNNIDPKIISHPANCQLLRHSDNSKKHSKSGILLKDLLLKISEWKDYPSKSV